MYSFVFLSTLVETDLEALLPLAFRIELLICAFLYLIAYIFFNPKLIHFFLSVSQIFIRSTITESNIESLSDHDLWALARKRSRLARSLAPTVVLCAIVMNHLTDPYNWLFAIIFGPLLAFSYYMVVGSIMDLQTRDDEASDEKTD
jgi:diacylglycerol kinase